MTYSPSKQLVDIFLKNGFKEDTEIAYPDHFKIIKENGYNSADVKRVFSYGNKYCIILGYSKIVPRYKGNTRGREIHETLTECELKSIIVFGKLPYQTQAAYKRHSQNITDLYKKYYGIKEHSIRNNDKGSNSIIDAFESVKLNMLEN